MNFRNIVNLLIKTAKQSKISDQIRNCIKLLIIMKMEKSLRICHFKNFLLKMEMVLY